MNSTILATSNENPYEYTTLILGVLFIISEVLPFLKKHKGNGLCETAVCMLRGSSCLAEKVADALEAKQEGKEEA
tara:strand:- start:372 stop:596 length:225 start_codon:yes stop_codon:yes gene_type:complete